MPGSVPPAHAKRAAPNANASAPVPFPNLVRFPVDAPMPNKDAPQNPLLPPAPKRSIQPPPSPPRTPAKQKRFPVDAPMPNEITEGFRYLPFGGGRRKCVGDQFALFEAVVGLAMLLRRFGFERAPDAPPVGMTTGGFDRV